MLDHSPVRRYGSGQRKRVFKFPIHLRISIRVCFKRFGLLCTFLIGAFTLNLILLLGAAACLKMCNLFVEQLDKINIGGTRLINFQAFAYGLAGTIVVYTAAISCFIDEGDPRHRVPTEVIIVFMLFLGTHLWSRLVSLSRMVFERTQAASCRMFATSVGSHDRGAFHRICVYCASLRFLSLGRRL